MCFKCYCCEKILEIDFNRECWQNGTTIDTRKTRSLCDNCDLKCWGGTCFYETCTNTALLKALHEMKCASVRAGNAPLAFK